MGRIRREEEESAGMERGHAFVDPRRSGLATHFCFHFFFVFFWTECFFYPKSRVPSPSVEQRIRERTNMRESRVCAPGCAGILGFIKFKSVTYGAATESGRDVEGVGREVMDRFYRES